MTQHLAFGARPPALLFCALIALLPAFVAARPAAASVSWCESDPIVRLNGSTHVQILIAIPERYVGLVDNPTRVEIKTPQQIRRELLYVDAGFNGKGEDFSFSDIGDGHMTRTHYDIWSKVIVPIKTSDIVPIRVTVIPSNGLPRVFSGDHKGTQLTMWLAR